MLFPKGPDPRRLLEEQAAFEEAERKRAELRAQAVFESFFNSSPVAIEIFDTQGNLIKSNKAAERLLGKVLPPGINLFEEQGLKRTGLLEPQLKRLLAGARIETPPFWYDPSEIGLAPTSKGRVSLRVTAFPLFDAEARVKMLAVVYEDLTELKKTEQALQELKNSPLLSMPEIQPSATSADTRDIEFARRKIEQAWRDSEERYRSLVESIQGACIIRLSDQGHILNISPSVKELFGVSSEAVLTDNALLFANVHPEDLPRVRTVAAEAKKTGEYPPHHRFRVIKKPGDEVVWLEMRGKSCTFASRRTFEVFVFDITGEKRLEELLYKKEQEIATILESPYDGIFAIDPGWVITAWSKGAEKETRISAQEAKGKKLQEVYPEMERSGMAPLLRKTLLEHQPQKGEFFYQDGRERFAGWFSLSTYPVENGALALIRNISGQKRIEQAWQDVDLRLRAILENDKVLIAFKDINLRYISANTAAEKILSVSDGGIIGKTDAELFPAAVTALLNSHDQEVLQKGQTTSLELCLGDPKAEKSTWISISKQPWRNSSGEIIGIVNIGFDITRQVRAQEELNYRRRFVANLLTRQSEILRKAEEEISHWTKKPT
ncbi:MAG: PAS domain S-box protein [bacterium]